MSYFLFGSRLCVHVCVVLGLILAHTVNALTSKLHPQPSRLLSVLLRTQIHGSLEQPVSQGTLSMRAVRRVPVSGHLCAPQACEFSCVCLKSSPALDEPHSASVLRCLPVLDCPVCGRHRHFSPLFPFQVDQRVFRDLMSEKLPRLHAHFEQYKVDYTLITFNWFLVVFVDSVVSDILFKIWDSFLYEGPKVGLLSSAVLKKHACCLC